MHNVRRVVIAASAALTLFSLWGCNSQPVAIVNGQRITRQEYYDRLEQAAGERVLADLIARRMLNAAFVKSGLKIDDQEINAEIEKMKKQAPDEASWQAYLKQQGMTDAEFKEYITFNLQVKKMAEKDVKYTEADLQKFFNEHKENFARQASVVLSEIVLGDKAKADEVRKQLNDPKASFATLARQYSVSAFTRERGGRRPEEPLAGIQPAALRAAVEGLSVGQISQPIQADKQWYIIKVDEKHAAEAADYAKIKDKVQEAYLYTHAKQVPDIIEGLRKEARVQIMNPKFKDMERMFGEQQQSLPTFGNDAKGGKAGVNGAPPATPAPAAGGAAPTAPAPAPAAPAQQ